MDFKYYDEDNDEIIIDDKSFGKDDCKNSKFWELTIREDECGGSSDPKELEKIKEKCIAKKEKMLKEAKSYKKKLLEECKSIIEKKIKEKNESHQKDLKNLKENYINSLKEFKSEVDNQTKKMLKQISEEVMNKYLESVKLVDKGVKRELSSKIDELVEDSKKSFDDINIRRIGILIYQIQSNLEEINKDEGKFYPFLIEDEIIKEVDFFNEKFSININVLNLNSENIKDEYELEITPNFKTKIDLSGISKGEFKLISINLDKSIEDFENNTFILKILKENEQVSNELKLTFKLKNLNVIGTPEDLFG